jgi:hypothetical protein
MFLRYKDTSTSKSVKPCYFYSYGIVIMTGCVKWDIQDLCISLSCLGPSTMCLYISIYCCVISFTVYNGIMEVLRIWLHFILHEERNTNKFFH